MLLHGRIRMTQVTARFLPSARRNGGTESRSAAHWILPWLPRAAPDRPGPPGRDPSASRVVLRGVLSSASLTRARRANPALCSRGAGKARGSAPPPPPDGAASPHAGADRRHAGRGRPPAPRARPSHGGGGGGQGRAIWTTHVTSALLDELVRDPALHSWVSSFRSC